ncbi:MAG: ATP-dependent DNA helicase [Gammaproteobacteria bacterium]|nr:MAG: ATP-dependent DNA helicase [Gammaproteobacteria bacterium]
MLNGNKAPVVAVKTLIEFAAKSGSLDRKFTPSPSGQEGIEGHKRVTSNRPDNYQIELGLSIEYGGLVFRGRADGYSPDAHCLEEIKTFYGDVDLIPENHRDLHWAQAKCYGWMLCTQLECEYVNLALIYFNLSTQKEYRFEQCMSAQDLKLYGESLAEKYRQWQNNINQRMSQLDAWIEQLEFPYDNMHPSQRLMAEAVYKAAAMGRVVLAEAPTGTGKTLAGLFPAIKSMIRTPVNKVFYLTAKTTGKQLALENIKLIATDKTPLRALELTAQEKACLEPDKLCRGDSCIYALDFYTKLQPARKIAYDEPMLDKQKLKELALKFEICPFYLAMEMSRWADVVVADVNYYFDGTPLLLGLTKEFNWKPYLLIDESHNLIERGRQMYSAELSRSHLLSAKKNVPATIKKSLTRINKLWLDLIKSLPEESFSLIPVLPEKFGVALVEFTNDYIAFLQKNPEHPVQHTSAQEFFFSALNYQKVIDTLSEDFCIDMQNVRSKEEVLTLRNLIPADLLAERLIHAHCACFFSATLHPAHYYHNLLGLPDDAVHITVPSPFSSNQLIVNIADNLSTRFKDREAAIEPLCDIIRTQINNVKGNAIVFFSSYDFLQKTETRLREKLIDDDIKFVVQSRRMNEFDRQEFINQFSAHNNLLGLAVLGGAFSEGIDLSGDALKGVFIATLGLPQLNPITQHLNKVMQTKFQRGYEFTFIYPGIQKVIQAAGRVIRTTADTGYLWLLDERFQQKDIKKLLPHWWNLH